MKDQRVRGEKGTGRRFQNKKKAANSLTKLVTQFRQHGAPCCSRRSAMLGHDALLAASKLVQEEEFAFVCLSVCLSRHTVHYQILHSVRK